MIAPNRYTLPCSWEEGGHRSLRDLSDGAGYIRLLAILIILGDGKYLQDMLTYITYIQTGDINSYPKGIFTVTLTDETD